MTHQLSNTKKAGISTVVILALGLAGCSGPGAADEKVENRAPDAVLESSKNIGWNREAFTFDGTKSSDEEGTIVEWRFDFGDGTKFVAHSENEAKPTHAYAQGGEYTVTLTVFDEGHETAGAESDTTSHTVAVNQRYLVPPGTVFANPLSEPNETVGMFRQMFEVREEGDRIEISIETRGVTPTGESRIEVRVLDDGGDEVAREEHTVGAQENATFELNDIVLNNNAGDYTLEVIAHSGGASFDGDVEVYYDAGYTN